MTIIICIIFETRAEFFPAGIRAHEARVDKDYCWAMTRAVGRPYCGRSGTGVLVFRLQLDTLVHSLPAGAGT